LADKTFTAPDGTVCEMGSFNQLRVTITVKKIAQSRDCRDLLNIGLMRPIFSPTEYIQIKGRGKRLFTFRIGNTEYEKKHFFLLATGVFLTVLQKRFAHQAISGGRENLPLQVLNLEAPCW
jgi:hypothetical protein